MDQPAARVGDGAGALTPSAALDRFFDVYFRQRPVTATFTGLHRHDDRLPDWSPEGLDRSRAEMAALRADLRRAGLPADGDVVAFPADVDLALADATLEIAMAEYDSGRFVHSNPTLWTGEAIFGALSLLTRDFAPLATRVEHARARLEATPHFLAQARHAILRAPKRWLAKATGECGTAVTLLREALPAWLAALDRDDAAGGPTWRAWPAPRTSRRRASTTSGAGSGSSTPPAGRCRRATPSGASRHRASGSAKRCCRCCCGAVTG